MDPMWTPYILIKILYGDYVHWISYQKISNVLIKSVTKILAIKFGLSVPEIFLPEIFLS